MESATELDRLIERRASRRPDPDGLEPSYAERVRRFHDKRRRADDLEETRYRILGFTGYGLAPAGHEEHSGQKRGKL